MSAVGRRGAASGSTGSTDSTVLAGLADLAGRAGLAGFEDGVGWSSSDTLLLLLRLRPPGPRRWRYGRETTHAGAGRNATGESLRYGYHTCARLSIYRNAPADPGVAAGACAK